MIETDAELGSEESHVDRAMLLDRGRGREVADGTAEPVDAEAGLPEQMVEDIETLGRE